MGRKQIEQWLLGGVDAGMAACIILVPAAMGGRDALGQLLLVAAALTTAGLWCLRQCFAKRSEWHRCGADLLLPVALAFVAMQTIPLPSALLKSLSPNIYTAIPLFGPQNAPGDSFGLWNTLSLTPAASRTGLLLLSNFVLLFFVAVQRLRSIEDVERLLRMIALATLIMAVFGLLQYLLGNGKYFWFYEHHYWNTNEGAVGSFTNRNHFAQYMAVGVGAVIWWSFAGSRAFAEGKSYASALRLLPPAVVVFAGLLSLSRGGAFCVLLAVATYAAIARRTTAVGRKTFYALGVSAAVAAAAFFIHGQELLSARFGKLTMFSDANGLAGRLALWRDDLRALADYPLAGAGLGSHCEVSPMYHADGRPLQNLEYTHAESGPVQVAVEGGAAGLLLAMAAACLAAYWCAGGLYNNQSPRARLCLAAVASGLAANFAHALVDFVWYVPGCMAVVVLLAAAACRLWRIADDSSEFAGLKTPRICWALSAVGIFVAGCFLVQGQIAAVRGENHWRSYLLAAKGFERLDESQQCEVAEFRAGELEALLEDQPHHARAHCRLAGLHLLLFAGQASEKSSRLDARQVRDAVFASHFQSQQEMREWLSRAFGERVEHLDKARFHARRALQECPLQAEAYLYLAQLCFLDGPQDALRRDEYIAAALRVRPFDAAVAFEAGNESLLRGDAENACRLWRVSFDADRSYRRRLIKMIAKSVDAAFFIETFSPDAESLDLLAEQYRLCGRSHDYDLVLREAAAAHAQSAAAGGGRPAAENWMAAAAAYEKLNDPAKRLACLKEAVRSDVAGYDAHYLLAVCCHGQKDYDTALEHFKWCLRERPYDPDLRLQAESALNRRLRVGEVVNNATEER